MRYEFHPEAEVDLIETILYYETQAPGLGQRFAAEVQHAIERLSDHQLLMNARDAHKVGRVAIP